jgi:hypothetical protein
MFEAGRFRLAKRTPKRNHATKKYDSGRHNKVQINIYMCTDKDKHHSRLSASEFVGSDALAAGSASLGSCELDATVS